MQLQDQIAEFEAAGIAVVALTYDSPELQQRFIDKYSITYPVLSDVDATSVRNLRILNAEYEPGDRNYGIPYPGIFVLNPEQKIVGKIFLDGYAKRVDAAGVLAFARAGLE